MKLHALIARCALLLGALEFGSTANAQSTVSTRAGPQPIHASFAPPPSPCVAWDATPLIGGGTITIEGFLVAQESLLGIDAFSAAARKWTPVAPAGSTMVGTGDWCLLMLDPAAGYIGYSARLNTSALLPVTAGSIALLAASDDDVACVVILDSSGSITAWAYSAVWGVWVSTPIGASPLLVPTFAISRFVVGIGDGTLYYGFSARTGAWSPALPGPPGALLAADGNTLLADFASTGTFPFVAAFSGVRGCWSMSPPVLPGSPVLIDHNVAYIEGDVSSAGLFAPTAYSAYRAAWFPFAVQPGPAGFPAISDNVVMYASASPGFAVQAFGAGHALWSLLPSPAIPMYVDEDYMLAIDSVTFDVYGFSGLCGGAFVFELNPSGAFPFIVAGPDHIGGFDAGASMHVFSPASSTWTPALIKTPFDPVAPADALIQVFTPGAPTAIATRWPPWVPTGPFPFGPVGTGSVVAHQDAVGTVYIFDERCDMWNPPFPLGAPHALSAGRNVVLAEPLPGAVGSVTAYSVQRCEWSTAAGFTIPALGTAVEENVAYAIDAGGLLWAYGSPNDGHVFYQWPNGTEYLVSGPSTTPGCSPTLFAFGVRSTPGNLSWTILGAPLVCPPFVIPGIKGELWLPLTSSLYSGVGVHDADCMLDLKRLLTPSMLMCIQPWMQALTYDFSSSMFCFGCRRADAAWLF